MANTERHHGADLAKWLGLVLMVLDHAWYVVPAEWQDVYGWVRVPGRLAFPIFCCVIAINVMRSPRGDLGSFQRNLVGLIGFELLSIGALHWNWPSGAHVTVLTTLAGGLVITAAIHHGTLALRVAACVIVALGFYANFPQTRFDFGDWGMMLPAVFYFVFRANARGDGDVLLLWLAVLMLMLPLATYGLVGIMSAMMEPPTGFQAWAFCATFIAPIVTLGLVQIELPRLAPVGKWAYVVHPAHYQALGVVRSIFGA